ncbi:tRNA-2-methylthio-N(6)-dimethylallyladenosine synthase [Seminavis robusta]|uniref:tRNA-2-methylthio-N(6)-dimethylallyladenosine synthase n=1 Tax=Seminavis robusta TaxID=568900 RepID=A0A9N8HT54_9STRA|nr:tRNA-2-methylthio-N(6)-dimethylallyladenosine synthase [Seminavis robusta]|eukprot:Sro1534_g280440.1 tRNA-2-methylthio-N(6)-dimethylallyladenosine synthase (688) ;mRNA; r:7209-9592
MMRPTIASSRTLVGLLVLPALLHHQWMTTAFSPVTGISSSAAMTRHSTTRRMVLSSPRETTTNTTSTTPLPRYPTLRGTEVDSRKIIATGAGRQYLTAIRLAHILFASRELAEVSLHQLRAAHTGFSDLAQQISSCTATRDKGGSLGWMNVPKQQQDDEKEDTQPIANNKEEDPDEHLDMIFPPEARQQMVQITTKPGDIVMVESSVGYHLVQVVDVMADVRKMASVRKPRKTKTNKRSRRQQPQQHSPKTYQMETMGCQMNRADSERMEGQLQNLGIQPRNNDDSKKPDIVVLNTCSIRDHAEQKVYSYIGPHAKRKREGEDVTIIVAGCVAQQEGEALLRRCPEVDLVMGPQYANRIGDLLEDVSMGNQVVATEATHIMEDSTKPRRQSTVAAWVNVIYGCNERCTFCIVPTTRGVEQSRPVESIIAEISELVQQGYKEVTLLGQNIDAYGRDMIPKRKFSDLIRIVGDIPGLERLRFVTSHPRYMSLGVVDAVAETDAACENFHIPFQSGSNEVLAAMGRGHTREKYLHIVDRIRSRLPDAAITADVIVGFPGETEEQFQETLSLMEEVVFDTVNTAAYSPRPNTPAALWDNQVADDAKQDRLRRINELNLQHAAQRRSRLMGRTVEILVEERNVKRPTQVMGRSTHGFIVYCDGDIDELRGKLVKVHIDTCQTFYLSGTIVEE